MRIVGATAVLQFANWEEVLREYFLEEELPSSGEYNCTYYCNDVIDNKLDFSVA